MSKWNESVITFAPWQNFHSHANLWNPSISSTKISVQSAFFVTAWISGDISIYREMDRLLWPVPNYCGGVVASWLVHSSPDRAVRVRALKCPGDIALCYCAGPGAIIGDGDRKRAPFQVLGLSPWYGTIIIFLEQIAPSPAAHARACCEDYCGCRAGEMASEIPEMFHVFARHNSARLRLLEFCLSILVVSCSSLSEVRQCRI